MGTRVGAPNAQQLTVLLPPGLKYDDLIMEQLPDTQVALSRLPAAEMALRSRRAQRAIDLGLKRKYVIIVSRNCQRSTWFLTPPLAPQVPRCPDHVYAGAP